MKAVSPAREMGLSKFIQQEFYVPILHFFDLLEDLRRGVSTQQNFELSDLGVSSHLGNKYQPVGYRRLRQVLRLARRMNPQSTFVDIGCGLGRPIILALEFGFPNVIGIDISDKLIDLCKKNIPKGQDNVKLICCDVEDYSFPIGPLTVFLFNPFDRKRLENLVSKLEETNSNSLIIYFNPKYYDVFKKNKLVRELKWQNFGLFEEKCHFYRY